MTRNKRLARLLEIIMLVQTRPDWRPKMLAEHFGISATRLHEDIRELVEAGVPICFVGAGYTISKDFMLGPTSFTPEEILDLLYPRHLFAEGGEPQSADSVLYAKLVMCLPETLRTGRRGAYGRARIHVESSTVKSPHFRKLHDAVAARRRISIKYSSRSSGKTLDREVDPYALIFRNHSWYLVGKCHLRNEVRKFRISRMLTVSLLPFTFSDPDDFSLENYLKGSWEVWSGAPVNVAIRFSRRVADLIRDHAPRPDSSIQEMAGGEIIYRVKVKGTKEIGWWVLQYGADAEVLEPAELRAEIAGNAGKMVKLYMHKAQVKPVMAAEAPAKYSETAR